MRTGGCEQIQIMQSYSSCCVFRKQDLIETKTWALCQPNFFLKEATIIYIQTYRWITLEKTHSVQCHMLARALCYLCDNHGHLKISLTCRNKKRQARLTQARTITSTTQHCENTLTLVLENSRKCRSCAILSVDESSGQCFWSFWKFFLSSGGRMPRTKLQVKMRWTHELQTT